jgi:hypothetical protein
MTYDVRGDDLLDAPSAGDDAWLVGPHFGIGVDAVGTEVVDELSQYRRAGTLQGSALVPEIPVVVDIELGGARRVPWMDDEGYAEEGRAWLLVEVSGFSVEGDPPLAPIAGGLATDGTLTIVDETGAEHPALPGLLEPIDVAGGGTTVIFDVPETFMTGTLRITPGANPMYSIPTSGVVGPPWHTPPPPQDIEVELVERTP